MGWRQIFVFDRLSTLLTMSTVVGGWVVFGTVVIGMLALVYEGLSPFLHIIGVIILVLPVTYAAVAIMVFCSRN